MKQIKLFFVSVFQKVVLLVKNFLQIIKLCNCFISNRKRLFGTIIISLIGALFINIAGFIRDNIPYTFFEDLDAINYLRLFYSGGYSDLKEREITDAVFIDVSQYIELVGYSSALSPNGMVPVVNRDTILHFLQKVESLNFSYMFLDIYFQDGLGNESSTKLFKKIKEINKSKERIIVCRNIEVKEDPLISDCSAPNLYYEPRFSRMFTRALYIHNGIDSVPLKQVSVPVKIFNAIHPDTISIPQEWRRLNIGEYTVFIPLSFTFRNSPLTFVPLDEHNNHNNIIERNDSNTWGFYDISNDINSILNISSGKILFVGDMRDMDMHATYARTICGPYLTYLQYKNLEKLMDGKYYLLGWSTFILYFFVLLIRFNLAKVKSFIKQALLFCVCGRKIKGDNKQTPRVLAKITCYIKTKSQKYYWIKDVFLFSKALIIILISSFLGYTFIFALFSMLFLVFYEIAYSTLVPSIMFTILELGIRSHSKYNKYKNKKEKS